MLPRVAWDLDSIRIYTYLTIPHSPPGGAEKKKTPSFFLCMTYVYMYHLWDNRTEERGIIIYPHIKANDVTSHYLVIWPRYYGR